MKCPACEAAGLESAVMSGFRDVTLMGTSKFMDKDGQRHIHDPNRGSHQYLCSNGHEFYQIIKYPCQVDGCEWNENLVASRLVMSEHMR